MHKFTTHSVLTRKIVCDYLVSPVTLYVSLQIIQYSNLQNLFCSFLNVIIWNNYNFAFLKTYYCINNFKIANVIVIKMQIL